MQTLPDKRKPAGGATGSLEIGNAVGGFSFREPNPDRRVLQAKAIHRRFAVTWPVAMVIAEHAFSAGRAA